MKKTNADTDTVQFSVTLAGREDIDREDIDAMTRQLRSELEEVPGAERVRLQTSGARAPKGAKSGAEAVALGAVLVAVLPAALPALIDFFKEWTLRPGNAPVKIKVQQAAQSVEMEFDPGAMTDDQAVALVSRIQALMERTPSDNDGG